MSDRDTWISGDSSGPGRRFWRSGGDTHRRTTRDTWTTLTGSTGDLIVRTFGDGDALMDKSVVRILMTSLPPEGDQQLSLACSCRPFSVTGTCEHLQEVLRDRSDAEKVWDTLGRTLSSYGQARLAVPMFKDQFRVIPMCFMAPLRVRQHSGSAERRLKLAIEGKDVDFALEELPKGAGVGWVRRMLIDHLVGILDATLATSGEEGGPFWMGHPGKPARCTSSHHGGEHWWDTWPAPNGRMLDRYPAIQHALSLIQNGECSKCLQVQLDGF